MQLGHADAYLHAFDTLRTLPLVSTPEDNARLTDILQRLVDEHGARAPAHRSADNRRLRARAVTLA